MSEATGTDLGWELADRLHKALRVGRCKPGEMRLLLGVSGQTITNYLNGRTVPKDGMLREWARRCEVPFEWLRDGDDPQGFNAGPVGAVRDDASTSSIRWNGAHPGQGGGLRRAS